jgi:cob(I)alamin adenosyltransferase
MTTETTPNVPPVEGAREARYAEAIIGAALEDGLHGATRQSAAFVYARAAIRLADAEVAAAVSEAQAEVERASQVNVADLNALLAPSEDADS